MIESIAQDGEPVNIVRIYNRLTKPASDTFVKNTTDKLAGFNPGTGWVDLGIFLQNSWANFGPTTTNPGIAVRKVGSYVQFRGVIKSGTVANDSTGYIVQIPPEVVPTSRQLFACPTISGVLGFLTVITVKDGAFWYLLAAALRYSGTNAAVSLNNIHYRV